MDDRPKFNFSEKKKNTFFSKNNEGYDKENEIA